MILRMPAASRWLPGAVLALSVSAAACGGGGGEPRTDLKTPEEKRAAPSPAPTASPTVDPADERVIRAWADTLRRGDVAGAARYFALPSLVSNGTQPIRLTTRKAVEAFNATLPCGAKVIKTAPAVQGFVYATFRLTERPGAGRCGSGTGGTARTAFHIRKGRITDWVRVPDEEPEPAPATQS
jgi:hypothetical protein